MKQIIIIIGGGNMGSAIAHGIRSSKVLKKFEVLIVENNKKRLTQLKKQQFYVSSCINNTILAKRKVAVIIIAVKPNDVQNSLIMLRASVKNIPLITVAAGIKIKSIEKTLIAKFPVIRVMPNTPCQIRSGISAITFNQYVTQKQKNLAKQIFSSLGEIIESREKDFNTITAISGSGPAYFCYFLEGLVQGGKALGLSTEASYKLALETGLGTLKLLKTRPSMTPVMLRKQVTSPKGTTAAAIAVFNKSNLEKIIYKAVKAAKNKGVQLGKLY